MSLAGIKRSSSHPKPRKVRSNSQIVLKTYRGSSIHRSHILKRHNDRVIAEQRRSKSQDKSKKSERIERIERPFKTERS